MPLDKALTTQLDQFVAEIKEKGPVQKIDWTKLMQLLVQILPMILVLFQEDQESKPQAK